MRKNNYKGIHPYVLSTAHFWSVKLTDKGFYYISDIDDLEQEFVIHIINNTKSFDSSLGSFENFVTHIAKNKAMNLINKAISDNKKYRLLSLDTVTDFENDATFSDFLEDKNALMDFDNSILSDDIFKIIESLPDDLKQVCRVLQDSDNITEASRRLNLTRRSLYRRIEKIKEYFKEAGME